MTRVKIYALRDNARLTARAMKGIHAHLRDLSPHLAQMLAQLDSEEAGYQLASARSQAGFELYARLSGAYDRLAEFLLTIDQPDSERT